MRTEGLTYSDHIVPSVKNLISWTQTEAIFKKNMEEEGEGLFAFGVEVGIIPVGLTSAEVRCLLAMSHHDSSLQLRRRCVVPAGRPLTGSSCHFNTEKCTRMTNCRQDAPRYWKAPRLCPLVFFEDTFLSLCTRDKEINRALSDRGTAS